MNIESLKIAIDLAQPTTMEEVEHIGEAYKIWLQLRGESQINAEIENSAP